MPRRVGHLGFRWAQPVFLALFALAAPASSGDTTQGEYLVAAGGCVSCHTAEDGEPLAGGRALDSPFGVFYAPNITPHATGIGGWSDEDFIKAFRHGESPDGDNYFPAFPYPAYTGVTDDDLLAIKAYLDGLAPVDNPNREHELDWFVTRLGMTFWNWLYFEPGEFVADEQQGEQWNRGAYLVRHLGHCSDCHTPRGALGGLQMELEMAGNADGPEGERVPNITPDEDSGIGKWSEDDIAFFLELGMLPDGDFTGGSMGDVIKHNTSRLTTEDREAIAHYLATLPPRADASRPAEKEE